MADTDTQLPASVRWRQHNARAANAHQIGDQEAIKFHRLESRALRLQAHIENVLAEAPPLTAEQRERLAALFRQEAK